MANNFQDYDPMIYDVMRELSNQLVGRYSDWQSAAVSEREADYWLQESLRVSQETLDVDARDLAAVQARTAELRKILAEIPAEAPSVA